MKRVAWVRWVLVGYFLIGLPGAQEEHGADRHAVCAGQSVDGKAQADGLHGTGACARCVMPLDRGRIAPGRSSRGSLHTRNCSASVLF